MVNYLPDAELRRLGLDHLIRSPLPPEDEAGARWRRILDTAGQETGQPDPRDELLAQVAASPFDPASYAAARAQLGLQGRGLIESRQIPGDSRRIAALLHERNVSSPYQNAIRALRGEADAGREDANRRAWNAQQTLYGIGPGPRR